MGRYLINRVGIAIPTLLAISAIIFGILALAPGDPLGEFAANGALSPEVRSQIRAAFGLDQPIYVRYVKWLLAFLRGDFGYSFVSRSPVGDLIAQRLPTTLAVVGVAYLFSAAIALPLGLIAAIKRHGWVDRAATIVTLVGFSLPPFFTGLLAILLFSVQLRWLPFIYDSNLQVTDWGSLLTQLKQSVLPIGVLALFQSAGLMRFTRASVLEQVYQGYVRTARAKGLPEWVVVGRHILRNALIPVVTLVALDVPSVFTGAIVTEQVFRVPGIGSLLVDSIQRSDTPVVMAISFIYAILIVLFNLIADILYGLLDPRVRLDR
jgi:peptide/nickel transport system permease protein